MIKNLKEKRKNTGLPMDVKNKTQLKIRHTVTPLKVGNNQTKLVLEILNFSQTI